MKTLHTVICPTCDLATTPGDYGYLKVAVVPVHEDIEGEDGYAIAAEGDETCCKGSGLLGIVSEAGEVTLNALEAKK